MQRSIIAPAERVTNLRWAIGCLVGFGVLVGTLDQVNFSVAGMLLQKEFGITEIGYGWLASAFGWGYAIAQIPFGLLLDRIGVAKMGRIWSGAWSIVALLTAFVPSFEALIGARAAFGITRAPLLPTSAKATGYWFPTGERSTGSAMFDTGSKLAIGIGLPVMAWLVETHGWRSPYLLSGALGIVFFALWFVFYRDPAEHKSLTYAEKQHLAQGNAQAEGPSDINPFALRKVWGLTIGYAAYAFAFFVLLTWVPSYMARTFSLAIFPTALGVAIPWLVAAAVDVLIGGMLVDALIKRGMNATNVRRAVLIIGMILGLAVVFAATTKDSNVAITCIAIGLAGLGMSAPVAWSLPSLIAPRGTVGSVAGLMNCAGAFAAIAAPVSAGYIVNATASFTNVFLTAAVVLVIGILSYVFVLGRIEAPEPVSRGILI